ncbi:MAG: permease-like cell division protein FtsX [Cyclobacteriaceae bacterium]|nr:permease-like cell division protein FtsX [Cyclobacteriaceae bacterium SS2]
MEQKTRKKRKLGSYPFISVTISITLALLVMGIFGLLVVHAKKLTLNIQESIEIQVFLNNQLTNTEITRINRSISSKPYTLNKEEGPGVKFISKDEASKQFIKETGEDFTEFLGDNPLRDLLVVNIAPEYQAADSLKWITKEIQSMNGVYEVAYVESLIESINDNITKIGLIMLGFFILLLIVVVILINNTIKLALFSQRFLIRSMQLVGAKGSFIRGPFLKRAAFYGLVAGTATCIILVSILYYANQRIEDLEKLQDHSQLAILFVSIILVGILVGYFSTYRAIRKYLGMSLDELY